MKNTATPSWDEWAIQPYIHHTKWKFVRYDKLAWLVVMFHNFFSEQFNPIVFWNGAYLINVLLRQQK